MKKHYIFFIVVICITILTSCWSIERPNSIYNTNRPDLFSVAINNVFGIEASKWDELSILEEDSQGRVLFEYCSDANSYPNGRIYVILICQQSDDKYAYYYDNYCFFVVAKESEITDEKINTLKELNDWDENLNNDKMTKVECTLVQMQYTNEEQEKMNEKFCAYLIPEEGYIYDFHQITVNKDGKQLYFIRRFKKRTEYEAAQLHEAYIMILNQDGSFNSDTFMQEVEDEYNYQKQLQEFKLLNSWDN